MCVCTAAFAVSSSEGVGGYEVGEDAPSATQRNQGSGEAQTHMHTHTHAHTHTIDCIDFVTVTKSIQSMHTHTHAHTHTHTHTHHTGRERSIFWSFLCASSFTSLWKINRQGEELRRAFLVDIVRLKSFRKRFLRLLGNSVLLQ